MLQQQKEYIYGVLFEDRSAIKYVHPDLVNTYFKDFDVEEKNRASINLFDISPWLIKISKVDKYCSINCFVDEELGSVLFYVSIKNDDPCILALRTADKKMADKELMLENVIEQFFVKDMPSCFSVIDWQEKDF